MVTRTKDHLLLQNKTPLLSREFVYKQNCPAKYILKIRFLYKSILLFHAGGDKMEVQLVVKRSKNNPIKADIDEEKKAKLFMMKHFAWELKEYNYN